MCLLRCEDCAVLALLALAPLALRSSKYICEPPNTSAVYIMCSIEAACVEIDRLNAEKDVNDVCTYYLNLQPDITRLQVMKLPSFSTDAKKFVLAVGAPKAQVVSCCKYVPRWKAARPSRVLHDTFT